MYSNVFEYFNQIFHVGYDKDGKRFVKDINYEPQLGLLSKKETGYKTIFGEPVKLQRFDDIKSFKEYIKTYEGMMPIYNNIAPQYQFVAENYPFELEYNFNNIQICFIDIETDSRGSYSGAEEASKEIISISCKLSKSNNYHIFGLKDFDTKNLKLEFKTEKIVYNKCKDEFDLLDKFTSFVHRNEIDIFTGWNIRNFDIPYIIKRLENLNIKEYSKRLCVIGSPRVVNKRFNEVDDFKITLPGVSILDYMDMYKKRMPAAESYALSVIAMLNLKDDKMQYEDENLAALYEFNFQTFIEYNMYDCELIDKLERKLGLIRTQISLAYLHKVNYEDVFSPVKSWDVLIYNYLWRKNIIIPPMKGNKKESFVGAYVQNVIPGIYKWVMSFDADSLYPHIIIMFNISPETIIGKVMDVNTEEVDSRFFDENFRWKEDSCLAPNGVAYSKKVKGFMPELMEYMYSKRKLDKKKSQEYESLKNKLIKENGSVEEIEKYENLEITYNSIQLAEKISLNSCYGATSNSYFRYFDIRMSESITLGAQLIIRNAYASVENYFKKAGFNNVLAAGDTDSAYFTFGEFVEKKAPNASKQEIVDKLNVLAENVIRPLFKKGHDKIAEQLNCVANVINMKRENIAETGLWTAKKHYALYVWDKEGERYDKPKLKCVGLSLIQSSTPRKMKPYLEEAIVYMMKSPEDLNQYITNTRAEFKKMSPEDIAFPRSANNLKKYYNTKTIYGKGCPIAVRGALVHNELVKNNVIEGNEIKEGEKVKYLYMTVPNPYYNSNVVSFIKKFRFDNNFVDYDTMFNKIFYEPVEKMGKQAGINFDKQVKYDDLF